VSEEGGLREGGMLGVGRWRGGEGISGGDEGGGCGEEE